MTPTRHPAGSPSALDVWILGSAVSEAQIAKLAGVLTGIGVVERSASCPAFLQHGGDRFCVTAHRLRVMVRQQDESSVQHLFRQTKLAPPGAFVIVSATSEVLCAH